MTHWRLPALVSVLIAGIATTAVAGDVNVDVDDHRVVRIMGSDLGDSLEITPGELDGSWLIAGVDGTTIDGAPELIVVSPRGLRAEMGDGDDRLELRRITVTRDLRVHGDDGHDATVLRDVVVRGRTSWTGGRGDDRLDVDGSCVFRRAFRLQGKQGHDTLIIKGSRVLGPTRIRGNKGDDSVILRRMSFTDSARLRLLTGSGRDVVTLESCKLDRDTYVGTGRSDDYVTIADSHANADFRAELGRADDRINVDDTTFDRDVKLDGDSGRDTLDFDGDVRFRGVEKRPDKYHVRLEDFEHRR